MDDHHIVRAMLLPVAARLPAPALLARAVLDRARPHADWLLPDRHAGGARGPVRRSAVARRARRRDPARGRAGHAARVFKRFFGRPAPRSLGEVRELTPGDFTVVARQLRHVPVRDDGELVERLRSEVAARPAGRTAIGF